MVETSCKVDPPLSSCRRGEQLSEAFSRPQGVKPPNGAVVKSYGAERLGKGFAKSEIRYECRS